MMSSCLRSAGRFCWVPRSLFPLPQHNLDHDAANFAMEKRSQNEQGGLNLSETRYWLALAEINRRGEREHDERSVEQQMCHSEWLAFLSLLQLCVRISLCAS